MNTIPQLNDEGTSLLETAFIETELPEAEEDSKEDEIAVETDPIRVEFIKVLKRTYQ